MNDKIFLDTNVLVYASLKNESNFLKRQKITTMLSSSDAEIIVSTQVINEYYRTLLKNGFFDDDIQKRVNELLESSKLFLILESTIRLSWLIRKRYQFSFWDSLIIASALESECSILYSEDLQHRQLVEGKLQIINPFS